MLIAAQELLIRHTYFIVLLLMMRTGNIMDNKSSRNNQFPHNTASSLLTGAQPTYANNRCNAHTMKLNDIFIPS